MMYGREQVRARQAVLLAKAELRRWEHRYDVHHGADPMRYVPQIKAGEERYVRAVERLRLLRDGRRRLPQGLPTESETVPRAPISHTVPD